MEIENGEERQGRDESNGQKKERNFFGHVVMFYNQEGDQLRNTMAVMILF